MFLWTAALCALVAGPASAAGLGQPIDRTLPPGLEANPARPGPAPVHLYFGAPGGSHLISETRVMDHAQDPVQRARSILEALIAGPRSELTRTLPAASQLRAVFVTTDSICIVDFGPAIRERHPGGCSAEMLSVYSIVNSLVMNIPAIKQVKFLIEGNDIESIAGHVNMQDPIPANMLIIR